MINVIKPVFLVGMVQTALQNVVQTATAVTDSMGTVSLDVSLGGKEYDAKMHVVEICMGIIVR